MIVRPAELSDYESITAIRNDIVLDLSRLDDPKYVAEVERNGFLLPVGMDYANFAEHLPNFIVSEVGGEVNGFLRIENEPEMDPDEVPTWIDPAMEETYWNMPHAGIGKIAVSPSSGRRGIASALLAEAERRTQDAGIRYLFSFIVTCDPPTNHASIRFHEKHGFREVAPLEPQVAYGISDYVATLYGKRLS